MTLPDINIEIEIPKDVQLDIEGNLFKVKGPKGEVQRKLASKKVTIKKQENKVTISSKKPSKSEKTIIGTFKSHINNMILGVKEGFTYKLKVCSGHFPMTVALEGNEFVIKNFFGEKVPRKVKLPENVDVKIEGDIIIIESADKEAAGLAASSIELLTRRPGFDTRVFQDGCYIITKGGKPVVR